MTKVAEYRDIEGQAMSERTTIKEGKSKVWNRPIYLQKLSEGWICAGSMARWQKACFSVASIIDGARHSQAFSTIEEAELTFDNWTTND